MTVRLKMESKTFHTVKYSDLEEFIQNEFGRPDYSFVADQECSNDSSHTFYVGELIKLGDYDRADILAFQQGNGNQQFLTGYLLQYLFEMGQIPSGEYLVEVSW